MHNFCTSNGPGCFDGFFSGVHENENLELSGTLNNLLVGDLVHELETLQGLLLRNSNVLLLKGHWTVRIVESEHV